MDRPAPDAEETEHLLRQAGAGDEPARQELLARHRAYLCRFVELRLDPKLRPRLDPSDVVQEAQLEAVRRLPDYLRQPALPFRLWLRQIAYDRLLMQLDPAQYPDPDRLDVARPVTPHLALGTGRNSCVGAMVIRMAASLATGAFTARFSHADFNRVGEWRTGSGFCFPASVYAALRSS